MYKLKPQRLHPRLIRGLSHQFDIPLDYPIQPVPLRDCRVDGGFWGERLAVHREAMLPHAWKHLRSNIDNLKKAGIRKEGPHEGMHWADSDLFKVMEGAAYALMHHPDSETEAFLESVIDDAAAAQEPDGYLYTARSIDPANPAPGAGPTRWSFMPGSHELYCMGHMIEAGIAHYEATGRRTFLNVALLAANMIDTTFGPDRLRDVDGHQEIELALARLYRVTGDLRYLRLCRFFLDERGRFETRKCSYGEAEQDHLPVLEQKTPVGHAVRATYMYAAMADVAALMDDAPYAMATEHLWEEVVGSRLALTGAVGARHEGEAFGEPYELPNADPHNETCAAVGMMLWSYRLFLLNGDSKYLDVLERTLYNAYLSSHALDGRGFFYCNPLEVPADMEHPPRRPEWQGCACCPTNVARITPSVPGMAYAVQDRKVTVGLYMQGRATIQLGETQVRITQETRYPWEGRVSVTVEVEGPPGFDLALRIPGWATGRPLPSDLYRYLKEDAEPFTLEKNGAPITYRMEQGFAVLYCNAKPGEPYRIDLDLPMPIRRVLPHEKIKAMAGKVAMERGPLVYCLEGIDHERRIADLLLPDCLNLEAEHREEFLGGVTVLKGDRMAGENTPSASTPLTAIPYYAWNNRGAGEMAVWLRRDEG